MSRRSSARRFLSVLGALLLVGGIVAAVVLFVLGPRYRDRQVDQLARGLVGCVTPLEFEETGTFYVYQEVAGPDVPASACAANPRAGDFTVSIASPSGPVELRDDRSVGYNASGAIGTSIRSFEITEPGEYRMTVHGPDAGTRAAVGGDPDEIVGEYRRWALIAGLGGVIAGLVLLIASSVGGKRPSAEPLGPVAAAPLAPPAVPHASAPLTTFAPPADVPADEVPADEVPADEVPPDPLPADQAPPASVPGDPLMPPGSGWSAPSVDERRG